MNLLDTTEEASKSLAAQPTWLPICGSWLVSSAAAAWLYGDALAWSSNTPGFERAVHATIGVFGGSACGCALWALVYFGRLAVLAIMVSERATHDRCRVCGYPRAEAGHCPECGEPRHRATPPLRWARFAAWAVGLLLSAGAAVALMEVWL